MILKIGAGVATAVFVAMLFFGLKVYAFMAEGDRFWWYVCTGPKAPYCTLFIDHPATELRVWLWQTWKRQISGILVWQTNYWTSGAAYPDNPQNPYEDPMGWVSGYSTAAGTRRAASLGPCRRWSRTALCPTDFWMTLC